MDGEDLEKRKQEARRQMNEMHNRAQPSPAEDVQPKQTEAAAAAPKAEKAADKEKREDLFSTLLKDKDRTIILALLLLLLDEGGDQSLILALIYLLL